LLACAGIYDAFRELKLINRIRAPFWKYVRFVLLAIFFISLLIGSCQNLGERRLYRTAYLGIVDGKDVEYLKGVIGEQLAGGAEFYVVMTEPQLYYIFDKDPITRFPFISPYGYAGGKRQVFYEEIILKLAERRPEYIIVNDKSSFWDQHEDFQLVKDSENFQSVMSFIDDNYAQIGEHSEVLVYERKDRLAQN
ncbi:hypothetical protein DRN67_04470, partial [Candidatus Micrarchaeota archaeon]